MTCPWLHWTTENPSGMHRCQFQHLCVLILNCALALAIYIFVGADMPGSDSKYTCVNDQNAECIDKSVAVAPQHDDVIKWKRFPRYWPFVRRIHRSPVNSPHKDQWRGALVFYLIFDWINSRVNHRETGDLRRHRAHFRRHRAHYDVVAINPVNHLDLDTHAVTWTLWTLKSPTMRQFLQQLV